VNLEKRPLSEHNALANRKNIYIIAQRRQLIAITVGELLERAITTAYTGDVAPNNSYENTQKMPK
jgi:hypothetical protein